MKTYKYLTFGLLLLLLTVIGLEFYSYKTLRNLIKVNQELQNVVSRTDTLTEFSTDTVYLESKVVDKVPQLIVETTVVRDTVFQIEEDSLKAVPRVIILKKKVTPTRP